MPYGGQTPKERHYTQRRYGDRFLSFLLNRSILAIQIRRCRLLKKVEA